MLKCLWLEVDLLSLIHRSNWRKSVWMFHFSPTSRSLFPSYCQPLCVIYLKKKIRQIWHLIVLRHFTSLSGRYWVTRWQLTERAWIRVAIYRTGQRTDKEGESWIKRADCRQWKLRCSVVYWLMAQCRSSQSQHCIVTQLCCRDDYNKGNSELQSDVEAMKERRPWIISFLL